MKNKQNPNSLADRIRLIRLQTFFDNASGSPFALSAGGVFTVLCLRHVGVDTSLLLVWFGLVVVGSGLIFLFDRYVGRIGLTVANGDFLFRVRVVLGGAVCSLYGATLAFLPDQSADIAYVFILLIASTVVAFAYMAYATAFSYGLVVNALTLMPFTGYCINRYLNTADFFFLLIGGTALLWQLIIIRKAWQISQSAAGEIATRERLHDETAERKLAVEALKASEDQSKRLASMLRLMCDNVPDMIWAKDLESRYIFVNTAFCEILLGLEDTQEPLGRTYNFLAQRERDSHAEDPQWHTLGQFWHDVDQHTLGRDEPTIYEESGTVRGRLLFLDVHQARFVNDRGEVIGTVGCARDITERKTSEAYVQHLAHHDVLTDLPNRTLLTDRLRQALAHVRREREMLAVLFLDLDRLKPVNDTLGHDIGDLLLKDVAKRLQHVVTRESDTVSRLGGDEFVILLQRLNREQDAAAIAEKMLAALRQPFSISGHTIDVSASIGIAICPQHGDEVNQLLRNADAAMYVAKHAGRDAYQVFEPSMTSG